jgi:8-amino-7-oxononanoate synthase
VFGKNGCGIIQELGLENEVFARFATFGKGLDCHAVAILGSIKAVTSY